MIASLAELLPLLVDKEDLDRMDEVNIRNRKACEEKQKAIQWIEKEGRLKDSKFTNRER
jgi:hypothetical protein